jgi:pimeloyl-ACP methyl ester carboxylesterase
MAQTTTEKAGKQAAGKAAIRPFNVNVPQAELDELRKRINATRWPERETVKDISQGVQFETMQKLARYWATDYDWRKVEARLNALPHFISEVDGLDIHFVHARSKHEDALPIIVTHGWPGSIIEQLKIIDPLINPTAHGGSAADAFHVVVPSMPGYGYSGKPTATGWGPLRIARAWVTLMKRLGYDKFVAQGGDWGAVVVDLMAGGREAPTAPEKAPPELLAIHTNMAGTVPPEIAKAAQAGEPPPAGLSADEKRAYDQLRFTFANVGYAIMMATHPQSLTGIADSPIGLAAFMLDHDPKSYELIARVFDGKPEGLTRDDILDNITHFWLTNCAISAARLYWENKVSYFNAKGVAIPVAVSVFPDELYQVPKSWAEKAYPKLIHYNQLDKGGHFAAWEQPKLLVDEIRMAFKSLRKQAH